MTELRRRISAALEAEDIDRWTVAIASLGTNPYERRAVSALLEEMYHLIERRDEVDKVRDQFDYDRTRGEGPTPRQQTSLYQSTKVFFDTFYGALSNLASVIARFEGTFGKVNLSENARTVRWLRDHSDLLEHDAVAELETARLFRALLNHPQQFPVHDWATHGNPMQPLVRVILYGPESRSGKIPRGATREPGYLPDLGDWYFAAPDEVSVANCLSVATADCLVKILTTRMPGSGFRRTQGNLDAAIKLIFSDYWNGARKASGPGTN